jgi:hypothetical protein
VGKLFDGRRFRVTFEFAVLACTSEEEQNENKEKWEKEL